MCYLYLKLRVFLERKVQPKSVLKMVVSFIYSIDYTMILAIDLNSWERIM